MWSSILLLIVVAGGAPPERPRVATSTIGSPSRPRTPARTIARDGIVALGRGRVRVAAECLWRFVGPWLLDPRVDRFVPAFEGGRVVGVKVFALRSGGILAAFGIAPGEIVHRVAGRSLSHPEEGIALVAELERALPEVISVEVSGKPRPSAPRARRRLEIHVSRAPSACSFFVDLPL